MCEAHLLAIAKIFDPRASDPFYVGSAAVVYRTMMIYDDTGDKRHTEGGCKQTNAEICWRHYLHRQLTKINIRFNSKHDRGRIIKKLRSYFTDVIGCKRNESDGDKHRREEFVDSLVDKFFKHRGASYQEDGMFAFIYCQDYNHGFLPTNRYDLQQLFNWRYFPTSSWICFPGDIMKESCVRRGYVDVVKTINLLITNGKIRSYKSNLKYLLERFCDTFNKDVADQILRRLVHENVYTLDYLISDSIAIPYKPKRIFPLLISIFGPRVIEIHPVIASDDYIPTAIAEYQSNQDKLVEAMTSFEIDLPKCLAELSLHYL
jgi:hypothetical protein